MKLQDFKPHWWRYVLGMLLCFIAGFDITWFLVEAKIDFSLMLLGVVVLAAVPSIHGAVQLFNRRQLTKWVFVGIAYSILVLIVYLGRTIGVGWAMALS